MPTVLRLLRMLRTPGVPRKPKLAHVQDQPRSIYCQPCFRGEGGRTSRAVVLQGASTELPHPSPTESLSAWANPPRPHSSAPLTSQHKPRGYEVLGDSWRLGQRDTSQAATTCKDRSCIPTWFAAKPFSHVPPRSPPSLLADRAQAQGGVPLKHRLQRALFVLHLKGKEEKPERTCLARNLLHKCQLSAIDSKRSRRAVFIS